MIKKLSGKIGTIGLFAPDVPCRPVIQKRSKTFTLSYDTSKPLLYCSAKITIDGKTISTDRAIWDTGATVTAFSDRLRSQFGSSPAETGTAIGAISSDSSDIFLATLELPGDIIFHNVEVWCFSLSAFAADLIIGMDVISQGKLVVETRDNIPTFSFTVVQ